MTSTIPAVMRPLPIAPLILQREAHASTIAQAAGFAPAHTIDAVDGVGAKLLAILKAMPSLSGHVADGAVPVALQAPRQGSELTPEALLTRLMARLQQHLGDNNIENLRQRLASYTGEMRARAASGQRLAAAWDAQRAKADAALGDLEAATDDATQAQAGAEAARDEVVRLRTELEGMDPEHPDYAAKQEALGAARQQAGLAEAELQRAAGVMFDTQKQFDHAMSELDGQRRQIAVFNAGQPVVLTPPAEDMTASARLQLLILRLSELIGDHSLDKLKNESAALMEALRARQAQNQERARKHEEEQQRARDAESKTSCAGKVLGWVKVAVAAVASAVVIGVGVLTMQPWVVAGGVLGMAFTVDMAVKQATGFSVIGKLTEVIGDVIAKALIGLGVSESKAKLIANILATIVVAVLIIAASVATGNAAGAVQGLTAMATLAQQAARIMQVIAEVIGLAATITVGVGQIIVANLMVNIAELLAAIEKSLLGSEVLHELLETLREVVADMDQASLALVRQMSDAVSDETATAQQVIANMRTTA